MGKEERSGRVSVGECVHCGPYLLADGESAFLSTVQVPQHWSLSGLGRWGSVGEIPSVASISWRPVGSSRFTGEGAGLLGSRNTTKAKLPCKDTEAGCSQGCRREERGWGETLERSGW